MFACFKTDENLKFLTGSLKLECSNSVNTSGFSVITLVGTSLSWHILDMSNSKYLLVFLLYILLKMKKDLHTSPIVSMLG